MVVTGQIYPLGITRAYLGDIKVVANTIKCALLTSSYTPNLESNQAWSGISGNEVSGTGYTAGGATLSDASVGLRVGTTNFQFWVSECSWTDSTITARYAVIYDATTGYLICYVDFGEDKGSASGLFRIDFDATYGIFEIANGA